MNRTKSYTWENRPKYLNHFEILNPFYVLNHYYMEDSPEEYIEDLQEWEETVVGCECFHGCGMGACEDLLYLYEAILRQCEALFVLCEESEIGNYYPIISEEEWNAEKSDSKNYPNKLTKKECLSVYRAIQKVFQNIELQRLRDYLWEFVKKGLSGNDCYDMFDHEEVNIVFKHVKKLLSIAYLLSFRAYRNHAKTKSKQLSEILSL